MIRLAGDNEAEVKARLRHMEFSLVLHMHKMNGIGGLLLDFSPKF